MKNLTISLLAFNILMSTTAMAADLEANVTSGYDDNPYLLSDTFLPQSALFIGSDIKLRHRFDSGFGVSGDWDQLIYEGKSKDANRRTLSGGIDFRKRGTLMGTDVRYRTGVNFTDYDKTYISRSTGLVGKIGANQLGDRYDASWGDVDAGIEFRFSKKFRLDISANGRDRKYHDYSAVGASNLDFRQLGSRAKITFKPTSKNEFTASYTYRDRKFDDRRGRLLDSSLVAGSNLKYKYNIVEATWTYDISKKQDLRAAAYIENRSDNVTGFYNTTWQRYSISYTNEVSERQKLEMNITYRDYKYDNNDVIGAIEGQEPINSKKGFAYELSYGYLLSKLDHMNLWLVANGSYEDYNSVNVNYIYKQAVARLGIQLDF